VVVMVVSDFSLFFFSPYKLQLIGFSLVVFSNI